MVSQANAAVPAIGRYRGGKADILSQIAVEWVTKVLGYWRAINLGAPRTPVGTRNAPFWVFFTPPSMRSRRSQVRRFQWFSPPSLVDLQSISTDFLSFSINLSQL